MCLQAICNGWESFFQLYNVDLNSFGTISGVDGIKNDKIARLLQIKTALDDKFKKENFHTRLK